MYVKKWNDDWKFWKDEDSFALIWDVPKQAETVDLPHDAMARESAYADSRNEGNTGFRDGANYVYLKNLYAPEEWKDRTVQLYFEGVYMNAMVYVNGALAARCPYGYTGFYVPLDEHLLYDADNEIRVFVKNGSMKNSRWYSGSGIYRDVYLLTSDTVYIMPGDVRIRTESLDSAYGVITVTSGIKNRRYTSQKIRIVTEIIDPEGKTAASETAHLHIYEGEERHITQRITIADPAAWSAETPDLYQCRTSLYIGDVLTDENTETFGLRTLQMDAKRGLRINGKETKLRGACIHHDSGLLGAVTLEEAQVRQIRLLKEAGFNAVRISHHPAAPALLRACDHVGMYVMDESFDMWTRCKTDFDYSLYFSKWWKQDTQSMVKKDYNHPSVILYSIGNEIPEVGTAQGAMIASKMRDAIRDLDDTRFVLAAINGVFAAGDRVPEIMADLSREMAEAGEIEEGANVNDFMSVMDTKMDQIVVHPAISERLENVEPSLDLLGYNYMTARYEQDGKTYPNRVIVGSETYPPDIAKNWLIIKRNHHVIGDFTWTGWDYIGEAGVGVPAYRFGEGGFGARFPSQLAYCGDIDLTGFRRPASYFREVVFGLRSDPYITVQPPQHYGERLIKTPWVISDSYSSWTHPGFEGKPVVVEIYAPGDEVELFLNGRSMGRKESGEAAGYRILFELTYEPGELLAVTYTNEEKTGEYRLATAQRDIDLSIHVEEPWGSADQNPVRYIDIYAADKNGVVYDAAEQKLTAGIEGGKILGFGSGNPKTQYAYTANETETWRGHALLIVRKDAADAETEVVIESAFGIRRVRLD